jgi:hypothetical protein
MADKRPEWFGPKRYGLGAGMPIAWQGWVATLVYVTVVGGAAVLLAERSIWAFASIVVTATAVFLLITARTTRGSLRWRWGKSD